MILFSGCSHVLGVELEQETDLTDFSKIKKYRNQKRFCNLLSKKLDYPHSVVAESGADNSWITFNTIDYINKHKDFISDVVVSWSGITRVHKIFQGKPIFLNPLYPGHGATTSFPPDIPKEFSKDVTTWEHIENKYFLDVEFATKQSYHYINYLRYFLEANNINFIFIKGIKSDIDLSEFTDNYVNTSFIEFAEERVLELGKSGHVLSQGHKVWADYLYDNLKDKFSLDQSKIKMI